MKCKIFDQDKAYIEELINKWLLSVDVNIHFIKSEYNPASHKLLVIIFYDK